MLKRLYLWLFSACEHRWVTIQRGPLMSETNIAVGYYYDLQCSKCGNIKMVKQK